MSSSIVSVKIFVPSGHTVYFAYNKGAKYYQVNGGDDVRDEEVHNYDFKAGSSRVCIFVRNRPIWTDIVSIYIGTNHYAAFTVC